MSMVINTNVQATRTHGVYSRNNALMNEAMNRVATGMKINSAKDNASTWAITQRMRDRIRANDQANQNVQNDSALIRTAQGGIGNTVSILTTLKERAINAANDSNVNLDREAIAAEIKQLTQQIDDNATKVKFNGRYLLNGAADGTTATETDTTDAAEEASTIVEPSAASMPANTYGSHAVFALLDSTFKKDNGSGKVTNGVSNSTELTDLLNSSAGSNNTDITDKMRAGFSVGDTITFSWKEDGKENSYSYTVASSSAISDLAFDAGKLQVKYISSGAITNNETGKFAIADGTLKDKNAVLNSSDIALSVTGAGLHAIGDQGVEITDFKVSVTYNDFFNDKKETTRSNSEGELYTQDILKFTGVQQRTAEAETPTASASVAKIATAQEGGTSTIADENTTMMELYIGGNQAIDSAAWDDVVTFKWGDGDDEQVQVQGNTTLGKLNELLEEKGVTLNIVGNTAQNIKDADGNNVTVDSTGLNYEAEASGANTQADIYLVSKTGATLDASKVSISAVDNSGNARSIDSAVKATQVLSIAEEEEATEETTSTEPLTIGPSTPLTFHIGGEQDFAIDVTIDKMTVDNLFAQKDEEGNITKIFDDSTFSDLFKTKDGAKEALGIIDTALNKALAEQTKLGAVEARLGYTSDNLTTMNENLEAANSAFRDSDIAKEMTNYMKYAVLSQASQYMLAQAGQNSYQILNLLNA